MSQFLQGLRARKVMEKTGQGARGPTTTEEMAGKATLTLLPRCGCLMPNPVCLKITTYAHNLCAQYGRSAKICTECGFGKISHCGSGHIPDRAHNSRTIKAKNGWTLRQDASGDLEIMHARETSACSGSKARAPRSLRYGQHGKLEPVGLRT